MERKSQADERREEFQRNAREARELGDQALRSIDAVLADEQELLQYLKIGVSYGNLTEEEADAAMRAYQETRRTSPHFYE